MDVIDNGKTEMPIEKDSQWSYFKGRLFVSDVLFFLETSETLFAIQIFNSHTVIETT